MGRKAVAGVVGLVALEAAVYVVARRVSAQAAVGDETSAEIARTVIFGGDELQSRAPALRSVAARVIGGGIVIDLRNAGLDPEGAHLEVDVTMGGATIAVREDWRVTVAADMKFGHLAAAVADEDTLPDYAPHLHIVAQGRFGGIAVKAKPLR